MQEQTPKADRLKEALPASSERLERVHSEELDKILGIPIRVLDSGFVRVVDYMGSDESIVQAARVSYGKGTKKIHEDRGLIRYLMRHGHTTPFEMCEIKLHVRVPMDCWRQWIRHRTASINEYSTRYSVAVDATQTTPATGWRYQAPENRQGSSGFLDAGVGAELSKGEEVLQDLARKVYQERLGRGVAREQARKDLPLSTYTEAYWKIDLHNLFHFLRLRMDEHAQFELRTFAKTIGNEILSRWCPIAWEAFLDYGFNALSFSSIELRVLQELLTGNPNGAIEVATKAGLLTTDLNKIKRNREREELDVKLALLGIQAPWDMRTGKV